MDEYQDVNALQQELFEPLAGARRRARGPLLVAVGDLKQSIYRFRGADVSVFARVVERLGRRAPGASSTSPRTTARPPRCSTS